MIMMGRNNIKLKQTQIFNYFGVTKQLEKLKEELLELHYEVAMMVDIKDTSYNTHFIEECADVFNLIEQFATKYPEIYKIQDEKVDRTIKRYNIKEKGEIDERN